MIYDCVTLFNDIELLDLRLMTLYDTVDYFVIVEARESHIKEAKPLYFLDHQSLFEPYRDKIIYIGIDTLPSTNPRENEVYQRNLMAQGYKTAKPDDYIIINDIDEIANPVALKEGIERGYEKFGLHQKLFYYYVNCLMAIAWYGSTVWKRKFIDSPQQVRNMRGDNPNNVMNGGWHYSFLGGIEKIMLKLKSFSEQQVNTPDVNNETNIARCLETGEDIFHRTEWWAQKKFITMDEIDHPQIAEWLRKYPNNFKS